jgi:predicted ATPase
MGQAQDTTASSEKRFSRLRIENLRCFEKVEIPLDPRLTVIIGENGAGKTTVVEAIASLSYGDEEGLQSFPLRRGKSSGSIALFDAKEKKPQAVWRYGKKGSTRQRLPDRRYVFAYGRYRRVSDPASGAADDSPRNEDPQILLDELATAVTERRTTTLNIPDGRLLRDLSRYLVALHAGQSVDRRMQTVWKHLEESLKELGQGLERIEMVRGETAYTPMIVRHGVQLGINELSDGYQAVLVIVFDLMLRYANLFSSLEDPLEGTATVLIDEIDLHLHVRWQRTVLQQLTALFPKTQFIVTTHSPAVVQAAIDHDHAIIVLKETKGAMQAKPLSRTSRKRLRNASIGSVFVERLLFGADSRYSAEVQAYEEEVQRLRRREQSGRATDADRERLFRLLNQLEEVTATDDARHGEGPFMSEIAKLQKAFLRDLADELDQK